MDTERRVLFLNWPPTTVVGPHPRECPFRIVINNSGQDEVIQVLTLEPLVKPAGRGERGRGTGDGRRG
jgi:hypothetical protein